jgi:hypothetical protein
VPAPVDPACASACCGRLPQWDRAFRVMKIEILCRCGPYGPAGCAEKPLAKSELLRPALCDGSRNAMPIAPVN